jgi:penicillin V acylase-like amidase (Ntn superfamily)
VVQWVQYQLDTAATVGEVLDSLDQVAPAPILPAQECVHYFVTDAQGGVAIVEFLEGRPVVQHGTEACQCALANSTFERCTVAREKQPANESERRYLTGIGSIADAPSSTTRMERIDFAMSTLAKVHQPGLTQWNLVYEPEERCVWFRTERATKQRYLDLDDLNFSPSVEVKVLDLDQDLKGDVLNRLKFCEPSDNERLVNNAFDRYLPEGFMRTAVKKMVLDYPKKLRVQSPELATVP